MSSQPARASQAIAASATPTIVEAETLLARIPEIYGVIARRAFELFDSRGRQPGHDLDDWLRAEAELLLPLSVEMTQTDGQLTVRAEVPGFNATDLQVSVEAHRLIISGRANQTAEQQQDETASSTPRSKEIFRAIELPVVVDAGQLRMTLADGILTLTLPIVETSEGAGTGVESA